MTQASEYTVEIEAGNDDGTIWQAIRPAENVITTDSAVELAELTARNQDLVDEGPWRVCVWVGADMADSGRDPDAEVYDDDL